MWGWSRGGGWVTWLLIGILEERKALGFGGVVVDGVELCSDIFGKVAIDGIEDLRLDDEKSREFGETVKMEEINLCWCESRQHGDRFGAGSCLVKILAT
ncbi:hypothetical protein QYF36_021131 [Acer negundo]|nr:hypothetical protein QYF36_021131 [Acer negundo]